ncbi:hypothetical protein HanXRQr2_Chr13g0596641 [Helianthus annuus]|uniref:Uncharacterized protein n=1 Tax=Helianthus annuus TaxID=4232 RepID=A0A9K3EIZ6_HELAN|nr:hypothetical protein HanXRQr2_Chr13g0596641 [Helianthus annuus]KAJ0849929.1 hypothetical protein HanPSC8_Chr13g0574611 [Helianthus annuus]
MRKKSYFSTDPVCLIHTRCFDPGYINYLKNLNYSFATFHTYRTLKLSFFSFTLPDFPFFFIIFKAMKFNRFNVLSTRFVIFDCWWKTVEVLGCHSCPSGGGASIEEDGDGGCGLKRNYDGDMGHRAAARVPPPHKSDTSLSLLLFALISNLYDLYTLIAFKLFTIPYASFPIQSYKHLSAFVNWESARGGYNDQVNTLREGLMPYKQFIQELEDDVLPSEAERRYQEYKSQYISTQNWMALLVIACKILIIFILQPFLY